jgi:streptogramin lyase
MRGMAIRAVTGIFVSAVECPGGIAQFQQGRLYVATWGSYIYEVDPVAATATKFADFNDGLNGATSAVFAGPDTLLVSNYWTDEVFSFDGTAAHTVLLGPANGISQPFGRNGLLFDPEGDLYVNNYGKDVILRVPAVGGSPVVIADANDGLSDVFSLAWHHDGSMLIANFIAAEILRLAPDGMVTSFDKLPGSDFPYSIEVRNDGDVYVICLTGNLYRYAGGDPANRTLLMAYPGHAATMAIEFNLDHSALFLSGIASGDLHSVDPDTGVTTPLLAAGTLTGGVEDMVVYGPSCGPRFSQFGAGIAGAGGITPTLDGSGLAVPGGTITLHFRDFVGGAPSLLLVGAAAAKLPGLGGTLHVAPGGAGFLAVGLRMPGALGVPGAGDLDVSNTIVLPPSLACQHLYLQQLALDPAASSGISMTAGLDILFGL